MKNLTKPRIAFILAGFIILLIFFTCLFDISFAVDLNKKEIETPLKDSYYIDDYGNLYKNEDFMLSLKKQSAKEYPAYLMESLYVTDAIYYPHRKSIFITGMVIESKMGLDIFGPDMKKYVGDPSVVIMEYVLPTNDKPKGHILFHFLIESKPLWGYPYNADNQIEVLEEDYWEEYEWWNEMVHPRLALSNNEYMLYFLGEIDWPYGPLKETDEQYFCVFNISFFRPQAIKMNFQMYMFTSLFYQEIDIPTWGKNYKDYRFYNDTMFFQEPYGFIHKIQIVSYSDNDTGICFEFDISSYSHPRNTRILYK